MEELEVPTEHLQEKIHEEAEKRHEEKERWSLYVALSTAFMAVLAAVSGLLGGHHANEALLDQVKASNQWSYYQAKSIKSELLASNQKIVTLLTHVAPTADENKKAEQYQQDKEKIKKSAEESEKGSEAHLNKHMALAKAVTIFQIAIALSAISILTKRRSMWAFSLVLTVAGIVFLIMGIIN